MKRCIFHVPFYVDPNWISASHLRPMKMVDAFKAIGYQVEVISGYGKQRKNRIRDIMKMIDSGVEFDFIYSESSTMPTLLTEKNHFPTFPRLDFNFMKFCQKNGVKIGLFYRDMYWAFQYYRNSLSRIKSLVTIPMYKYDLKQYEKLVDILYLPSLRMASYIKPYASIGDIRALPPGGLEHLNLNDDIPNGLSRPLQISYVGAVGGNYNLINIFEAASNCSHIDFNFCLKRKDWEMEKGNYERFLSNDNIRIYHISGIELDKLLRKTDIAISVLSWEDYAKIAVPYKFFEYLSYELPVIGARDTAVGDFIEKNGCGWTVSSDVADIVKVLTNVSENTVDFEQKKNNARKSASNNRWNDRANQVAKELLSIGRRTII